MGKAKLALLICFFAAAACFKARKLRAFEVFGRSIVPHVFPEDVIVANPAGEPKEGEIVAVMLRDSRA